MARSRKIRKTGDCRAPYLVGTRTVTAKSLRFNAEHAATISRRLACSLHSGKQLFLPRVGWFGRDGAKTGILGSLWGDSRAGPPFFPRRPALVRLTRNPTSRETYARATIPSGTLERLAYDCGGSPSLTSRKLARCLSAARSMRQALLSISVAAPAGQPLSFIKFLSPVVPLDSTRPSTLSKKLCAIADRSSNFAFRTSSASRFPSPPLTSSFVVSY